MEKNWVKVYSTQYLYKAVIAESVLKEHGIKSVVVNKQDSAYLLGEVELFTTKENALRASNLIKEIKYE